MLIVERRPIIDVYNILLPNLQPVVYKLIEDRAIIEDHHRSEPISCTMGFSRNRDKVRHSLQNLFEELWRKYNLSRDHAIEYGSGATGYYDAFLRPRDVQNWLQVEINPSAIAENKKRNPGANIAEGSYNYIQYRGVPLITGLSSLDTSENLYHVMDQVAEALAPCGYFLHVQDVRPGITTVLNYLNRKETYPKEFLSNQTGALLVVVDGKTVPTVEIFREALGDAINKQEGLDLVDNKYFTIIENNGKLTYEIYDANIYAEIPLPTLLQFGDIDEVGHLVSKREVCVLATVAKRNNSF